MYRFIASDMDETFLAHDHSIPQANIDAIKRLRELGVLFVPSSGRPYPSVMQSLEPIRDLLEGSYVIAYNGGTINRVDEDEPLAAVGMDFDRMRKIFEYGKRFDVGYHIYELDGHCWGWRLAQDEKNYLKGHFELDPLPADSIDFLADHRMAKIIYCNSDIEYLRRIASELPDELLEGVDLTFSSGRYLEFMPAGIDKGHGVSELARILGCPLSDVIACGDAANDEAMVRAAGMGVAVRGAGDGLPQVADYNASSTCDDGLIAEVLRELVLPQLDLAE